MTLWVEENIDEFGNSYISDIHKAIISYKSNRVLIQFLTNSWESAICGGKNTIKGGFAGLAIGRKVTKTINYTSFSIQS